MAEQVVAEYKLQVDEAVKGLDKLQKEVEELKKGLGDSEKKGKKAFKEISTEASVFEKGLKKLGGALAAAFAVNKVIAFGKEVVTLAAKAEGVERAFRRIGSPQLLKGLRDATRGTVSDLQLMQRAVQASNFKIPLDQLAGLLRFAQARARETGESVDYLVDSIVLGIGRKSPLILDNLGISAVELRTRLKGVGVEATSVADIAKIVGNIADEELAKMGRQADTTADKIEQIQAAFFNLKIEAGKTINSIIAGLVKIGEQQGIIESSTPFREQIKQTSEYAIAVSRAADQIEDDRARELRIADQVNDKDAFVQSKRAERLKLLADLERQYATIASTETRKAENLKLWFAEQALEAAVGLDVFQRGAAKERVQEAREEIKQNVLKEGILQEQINALRDILGLQQDINDAGATEVYIRSINQLNKELKDLDGKFKDAEIGSKEWIDLIEKMFNKTEELNDVNEELAWRLAVLEGAFDNYESIDTKGIDNFTDSVEKASAAIKKAREEAQTKSLQLTGDEFIDPNLGFPNASSIINTQSDQETFDESLSQWNSYASSVAAIGDSISQIQAAFNQQELDALNYQLQQGEITRDEYDQRRRQIMEQQAEDRKAAAIFDATVTGFSAVVQAYNTDPTGILAGITAAVVAAQIAAISATPVPQYAKGVIDLKGAGTETSDSIHAKLSRGESVMTAKETRKYKEELWAIRRGNFEDLIITKYVKPMIDESLFKGFADLSKSAQLNGITANLKDHNILHGLDRLRQSQQQGFMYLAEEQRKLFKKQSRGGYRA